MDRIPSQMLCLGSFFFLLAVAGCGSEQRAWENAVEIDSQAGYKSFTQSYPNSEHSEAAMIRIGEHAWLEAEATDSIEAYQAFLGLYPDSGNVPAAVEFGRVATTPVNTLRQRTHRCQEISDRFEAREQERPYGDSL